MNILQIITLLINFHTKMFYIIHLILIHQPVNKLTAAIVKSFKIIGRTQCLMHFLES